jgi:CBS domain-containing protein
VIICDDGPVEGIFTERDALRCMANRVDPKSPITKFMTRNPCVVTENATIGEVIEKMSEGGYRHVPIVDMDGRLSGVAAVSGIVHYLVGHFPDTINNLPPEPGKSPTSREGA